MSSVFKEPYYSFSTSEEAEERIQKIYEHYCDRFAVISGTSMDFRVKDYDRRYPERDDYDYNCFTHYWLEETDFVFNGAEKIPIKGLDYDSIDDFYHGLCVVGKEGKYGLVDLNFNLILGLYYKRLDRFVLFKNLNEPICRVYYTDDETGWVDRNGRFLVDIGKSMNKKDPLSSMGRVPSDNVIWAYKSACKWVRVELKSPSFGYEPAYSFYDVDSQIFTPALFEAGKNNIGAESDYVNGMGIIKDHNSGLFGAVDINGRISVPIRYDKLSRFSDKGVAVFCEGAKDVIEHHSPALYLSFKYKKGGKWGALNSLGEVLFPARYDYAYGYSEGLAAVNLSGNHYVYLCQNPGFYLDDSIPRDIREVSFVPWFMGGKWGFVDENGNECIPIQYDKVSSFRNGISIVNKGGRWMGGSLRNPYDLPKYSQRRPTFIDGQYGIINKKGELIVPLIYSTLIWDDDTLDPTYLRGTVGGELIEEDDQYYILNPEKEVYLSPDGKVIEEFIYDGTGDMKWPL